ncbi:MAG: Fic family protein [Phycisphaerae bacterium]|nr:Fic family protein [Phycisphaerae bacterium]
MPRTTGTYRTSTTAGEAVQAFVPHPLPPSDPALQTAGNIDRLHAEALTGLARLEVAGRMVPSTGWFLYGFVRKEAVISSQIEGTQATLREVVTFEATKEANKPHDVEEVCNYVDAITYARKELADPKGLPVSTRLLCESHRRLMRGVRGADKAPGQVRKSQNWIGGTRPGNAKFVPPPPEDVTEAMTQLERWIHSNDALPPLIKAGLAHVQFETIHPFLDGNGRIGRLLIALLLEHWKLMPVPLLYLSLAFKRHQSEYYTRLAAVRTDGDWEGWTVFYLECVREAANDGVDVAGQLFELLGKDRRRLAATKRSTVAAIQLLDVLPEHPVVSVPLVAKLLKITAPTARKAVEIAAEAGVLKETSGKQRDRVFAYHKYLQILMGDEK